MLHLVGTTFSDTPLRLFSSHLVLLSLGALTSAIATWLTLPKFWDKLPHDHGKALTPGGELSKGKPTGAGIIIALTMLPILLLVMPLDINIFVVIAMLYLIMLFGYFDDRAAKPWGQLKKFLLDTICCLGVAIALYNAGANYIWLPLTTKTFTLSAWSFIPMATLILAFSVNSFNCSDGVDGLAGTLGIMSLLSIAALLYLVLGYKPVADYLLLPHYPGSAKWAILSVTISGAFAGYLWHNAEPSKVLMGDAGSRMFGLAIGAAVLATGNPLLIFIFAPMILLNGGSGLVKLVLLRIFKKFGLDTTPSSTLSSEEAAKQNIVVRGLHSIRLPLHDHVRKNLGWKNSQVLMRFVLIQSLLIPILFALFTKVR